MFFSVMQFLYFGHQKWFFKSCKNKFVMQKKNLSMQKLFSVLPLFLSQNLFFSPANFCLVIRNVFFSHARISRAKNVFTHAKKILVMQFLLVMKIVFKSCKKKIFHAKKFF
jgi:hypothetical protein